MKALPNELQRSSVRRALVALLILSVLVVVAWGTGVLSAPAAGSLLLGAVGITFSSVPSNLRVPFFTAEFDPTRAAQGPALLSYRALLIGQKTSAGTGTANQVYKVTSADQVLTYAGRGSLLHRQAIAWFLNNRATELWIGILADNGAGTAATGTLTVTGPATASGTLYIYFGGTLVTVGVTSGDAQNSIAAAINTAINAALDLPITSTVSTNVVTWTFRHKGTCGNDFDVRLNYQDGEATPAGVAVAIVAASGGATNPVLTSLIAALGDTHYHIVAHPYTDATSLTALETEMASRFGPMRMISGLAITSAAGTQSTLSTLGDTRNSPHSVIAAQPGKNPVTPPYEYGAALAAVVALSGADDPGLPLHRIPLVGVKAPAEVDRFTQTENNLLLGDGIATSSVAGGGVVQTGSIFTTYQTNSAGAPDESYQKATTMLILLYARYSWNARMATRYARHKVAGDGTRVGAGQAIITPSIGRAEAIAWFLELVELGLFDGSTFEQFKTDLVVERDSQNPDRMNWLLPPDLINQLVVGAAKIQFRL